jgi:non-specific protein-tyrosine kinase
MAALVKEMKARYPERILIFDSTSLLSRADAQAFSPLIDGVLLVVEAEKTSAQEIRRSLELLKDRPIMGIVFNKSREREN